MVVSLVLTDMFRLLCKELLRTNIDHQLPQMLRKYGHCCSIVVICWVQCLSQLPQAVKAVDCSVPIEGLGMETLQNFRTLKFVDEVQIRLD